MVASLSSPADVVNDALRRIGYKLRVGRLDDGSEASGYALDIYGQTRDTMLRDGDWMFAQREVNGTVLKTAPAGGYFDAPWDPVTYPPQPWGFCFEYPADCLKVRAVRPQPGFLIDMAPTPTLFNVVNDNGYTPARRVIVANTPTPVIIYAARVTDPAAWSVDFTEALCAALARRLAPSLANLQVEQVEAQDEGISRQMAVRETG